MGIRLGWFLLILLVMVIPLPGDSTHWFKGLDLIVHFALFGVLGGLNRDLFVRRSSVNRPLLRTLGILFMVVFPEILQSVVPTRSFHGLDLAMNGVGTGWGLVMGGYCPWITYLLVSSGLLGFSFGLNVLKEPIRPLIFGNSSLFLTALCLLIPVLFLAGFGKHQGSIDRLSAVALVLFAGVLLLTNPGRGVLVGSLALVAYLVGRTRREETLGRTFEIFGFSGFLLFLAGTGVGQQFFLEQAGLFVVGTVIVSSLVTPPLYR